MHSIICLFTVSFVCLVPPFLSSWFPVLFLKAYFHLCHRFLIVCPVLICYTCVWIISTSFCIQAHVSYPCSICLLHVVIDWFNDRLIDWLIDWGVWNFEESSSNTTSRSTSDQPTRRGTNWFIQLIQPSWLFTLWRDTNTYQSVQSKRADS